MIDFNALVARIKDVPVEAFTAQDKFMARALEAEIGPLDERTEKAERERDEERVAAASARNELHAVGLDRDEAKEYIAAITAALDSLVEDFGQGCVETLGGPVAAIKFLRDYKAGEEGETARREERIEKERDHFRDAYEAKRDAEKRALDTAAALGGEVERLKADEERDLALVSDCVVWIERLIEGAACAFCCPVRLTAEQAAAVRRHIANCEKHPLREAIDRLASLVAFIDDSQIERDDAGAPDFVHSVECPGACDYACNAQGERNGESMGVRLAEAIVLVKAYQGARGTAQEGAAA